MYRISQTDYNALVAHMQQIQNILKRAVVVDECSDEKSVPVTKNTIVTEPLHISRIQELFGANYKGVLLYNFETQQWNRSEYQGVQAVATNSGTDLIRKNWPDKFTDLVAMATMTMNGANFCGWCEPVKKPVFSQKGSAVVATFVCRDKATGKILPLPVNWIGVSDCVNGVISAPEKCYTAMDLICVNGSILLKELTRQYVK